MQANKKRDKREGGRKGDTRCTLCELELNYTQKPPTIPPLLVLACITY